MKNGMKRMVLFIALLTACVLPLSGCWAMGEMFGGAYTEDYGYTTGSDMRESVTDGYFRLTIHTDKDEFVKGETIDCWAEIEYIGDEDSITVYTYGDIITLDMTGDDVYYSSSGSYGSDEQLTLRKGVPVRYTLAESLPKSSSVLPGQYEIDANAYFGLSTDGAVSYSGYVSAVIVVSE